MNKYLYLFFGLLFIYSCESSNTTEEMFESKQISQETRAFPQNKVYIETVGLFRNDILEIGGKVKFKITFDFETFELYSRAYLIDITLRESKTGRDYHFASITNFNINSGNKFQEHSFNITRPGIYTATATVKFTNGYPTITSRPCTVEIKYPLASSFVGNFEHIFKYYFQLTSGDYRERGFYIYLIDGKLIKLGEVCISNAQSQEPILTLFIKGEETNSQNNPNTPGAKYFVALFHTHPPLPKGSTSNYRDPGPSAIDLSSARNLPGLVYDYQKRIYSGHDTHAEARLYTYGPTARPI